MAEHIKRQIDNLKKVSENNMNIYMTTIDNTKCNCTSFKHSVRSVHNDLCYICEKDLYIIGENYNRTLLMFNKKIYELRNILTNKLR